MSFILLPLLLLTTGMYDYFGMKDLFKDWICHRTRSAAGFLPEVLHRPRHPRCQPQRHPAGQQGMRGRLPAPRLLQGLCVELIYCRVREYIRAPVC